MPLRLVREKMPTAPKTRRDAPSAPGVVAPPREQRAGHAGEWRFAPGVAGKAAGVGWTVLNPLDRLAAAFEPCKGGIWCDALFS